MDPIAPLAFEDTGGNPSRSFRPAAPQICGPLEILEWEYEKQDDSVKDVINKYFSS